MRNFIFRSLLIVGVSSLLFLSACSDVDSQSTAGGSPDFSLTNLHGEQVALKDVIGKKKVLLAFWTTWCPYCVQEIPDLNRFSAQNKNDTVVYGINIQESQTKVARFAERNSIGYPVLLDTDGKVAGLYGVRGIPALFAIDIKGKIVYSGNDVYEAERALE
jgi:peroxiredoxin